MTGGQSEVCEATVWIETLGLCSVPSRAGRKGSALASGGQQQIL